MIETTAQHFARLDSRDEAVEALLNEHAAAGATVPQPAKQVVIKSYGFNWATGESPEEIAQREKQVLKALRKAKNQRRTLAFRDFVPWPDRDGGHARAAQAAAEGDRQTSRRSSKRSRMRRRSPRTNQNSRSSQDMADCMARLMEWAGGGATKHSTWEPSWR
mmetsp:Transcript_12002/g.39501  ORF Transcript_12002/g.39501 Transcript_12002/m.39501 type:complete len:162 (-) Transcript_12002:2816-3301(-)